MMVTIQLFQNMHTNFSAVVQLKQYKLLSKLTEGNRHWLHDFFQSVFGGGVASVDTSLLYRTYNLERQDSSFNVKHASHMKQKKAHAHIKIVYAQYSHSRDETFHSENVH